MKVAIFNEEQVRSWHERTGVGPTTHALLVPDAPDYGFADLTMAQAQRIDAEHLLEARSTKAAA